jgi:hypothetical protein
LLPGFLEPSSFTPNKYSCHGVLCHHWSKTNGLTNHRLDPPKLWAHLSPSSL